MQLVCIGDERLPFRYLTCGAPQGSVLGVAFYCIHCQSGKDNAIMIRRSIKPLAILNASDQSLILTLNALQKQGEFSFANKPGIV